MTAINPDAVAVDIIANCEAYDAGVIHRAVWESEQHRLWKMAADAGLASAVLRLVLRTSASGPKKRQRLEGAVTAEQS